jgi:hypothetical protein
MKKFLILLSTVAFFATGNLLSQDIIYKIDRTEIKAKIVEIQEDFIKYTLFDSPNSPLRNIRVSDVFMIIYQDGKRETFPAVKSEQKTIEKTDSISENPTDKKSKETLNNEEVNIKTTTTPVVQEPPKEQPQNNYVESTTSSFEREKDLKIGFSTRKFTNSSLRDDIDKLLGLDIQLGIEVVKDLTVELSASKHWKKLEENDKFRYYEAGFLFNYCPWHFYLGAGPSIGVLQYQEYDTSVPGNAHWNPYSYYAIGATGRIGLIFGFGENIGGYIEIKYTKINIEDSGERIDAGSAGISLGLILK